MADTDDLDRRMSRVENSMEKLAEGMNKLVQVEVRQISLAEKIDDLGRFVREKESAFRDARDVVHERLGALERRAAEGCAELSKRTAERLEKIETDIASWRAVQKAFMWVSSGGLVAVVAAWPVIQKALHP